MLQSTRGAYLFKLLFSFSLDKYSEMELLGHTVVLLLIFWRTKTSRPSKWLYQFTFLPIVHISTSSPTLVISCFLGFFYNSHSTGNEVISYCGINLHFLDDQWCWISFHICWWSVCFGKMSIQVFCPFFNSVLSLFGYWVVWGCLYILGIFPLSGIWFAVIFSHWLGCLFILLIVFFAMQVLFPKKF